MDCSKEEIVISARSRSVSVNMKETGFLNLTIKRYSKVKDMAVERPISSERVNVGGYEWKIKFYPGGIRSEFHPNHSAYVSLISQGTGVRTRIQFMLVDQHSNGNHKTYPLLYSTFKREDEFGYGTFIRRHELEGSDYLKNDELEIKCSIDVIHTSNNIQDIYTVQIPKRNLGKDYGELFESGQLTDITFRVQGEVFKAHRIILVARSSVFRAQLIGGFREQSCSVITVEDILPPVFKAMLKFIYTDTLPNEEIGPSSTCFLQHLLVAANRYILDDLQLECEMKLCENIDVKSLGTSLVLADIHHLNYLKAACLNFAGKNLAAILSSESYDYILESYPMLIAELAKSKVEADEGG